LSIEFLRITNPRTEQLEPVRIEDVGDITQLAPAFENEHRENVVVALNRLVARQLVTEANLPPNLREVLDDLLRIADEHSRFPEHFEEIEQEILDRLEELVNREEFEERHREIRDELIYARDNLRDAIEADRERVDDIREELERDFSDAHEAARKERDRIEAELERAHELIEGATENLEETNTNLSTWRREAQEALEEADGQIRKDISSEITRVDGEINLRARQAVVDGIDGRVVENAGGIEVLNDQIALYVREGRFTPDEVSWTQSQINLIPDRITAQVSSAVQDLETGSIQDLRSGLEIARDTISLGLREITGGAFTDCPASCPECGGDGCFVPGSIATRMSGIDMSLDSIRLGITNPNPTGDEAQAIRRALIEIREDAINLAVGRVRADEDGWLSSQLANIEVTPEMIAQVVRDTEFDLDGTVTSLASFINMTRDHIALQTIENRLTDGRLISAEGSINISNRLIESMVREFDFNADTGQFTKNWSSWAVGIDGIRGLVETIDSESNELRQSIMNMTRDNIDFGIIRRGNHVGLGMNQWKLTRFILNGPHGFDNTTRPRFFHLSDFYVNGNLVDVTQDHVRFVNNVNTLPDIFASGSDMQIARLETFIENPSPSGSTIRLSGIRASERLSIFVNQILVATFPEHQEPEFFLRPGINEIDILAIRPFTNVTLQLGNSFVSWLAEDEDRLMTAHRSGMMDGSSARISELSSRINMTENSIDLGVRNLEELDGRIHQQLSGILIDLNSVTTAVREGLYDENNQRVTNLAAFIRTTSEGHVMSAVNERLDPINGRFEDLEGQLSVANNAINMRVTHRQLEDMEEGINTRIAYNSAGIQIERDRVTTNVSNISRVDNAVRELETTFDVRSEGIFANVLRRVVDRDDNEFADFRSFFEVTADRIQLGLQGMSMTERESSFEAITPETPHITQRFNHLFSMTPSGVRLETNTEAVNHVTGNVERVSAALGINAETGQITAGTRLNQLDLLRNELIDAQSGISIDPRRVRIDVSQNSWVDGTTTNLHSFIDTLPDRITLAVTSVTGPNNSAPLEIATRNLMPGTANREDNALTGWGNNLSPGTREWRAPNIIRQPFPTAPTSGAGTLRSFPLNGVAGGGSVAIPVGTRIVISLFIRADANRNISIGPSGILGDRQTVALTPSFQRHQLRFTSTATNTLTQSLRMYITGTWGADSWFEWHSLFVGVGNHIASWVPAPEDLRDSEIATNERVASQEALMGRVRGSNWLTPSDRQQIFNQMREKRTETLAAVAKGAAAGIAAATINALTNSLNTLSGFLVNHVGNWATTNATPPTAIPSPADDMEIHLANWNTHLNAYANALNALLTAINAAINTSTSNADARLAAQDAMISRIRDTGQLTPADRQQAFNDMREKRIEAISVVAKGVAAGVVAATTTALTTAFNTLAGLLVTQIGDWRTTNNTPPTTIPSPTLDMVVDAGLWSNHLSGYATALNNVLTAMSTVVNNGLRDADERLTSQNAMIDRVRDSGQLTPADRQRIFDYMREKRIEQAATVAKANAVGVNSAALVTEFNALAAFLVPSSIGNWATTVTAPTALPNTNPAGIDVAINVATWGTRLNAYINALNTVTTAISDAVNNGIDDALNTTERNLMLGTANRQHEFARGWGNNNNPGPRLWMAPNIIRQTFVDTPLSGAGPFRGFMFGGALGTTTAPIPVGRRIVVDLFIRADTNRNLSIGPSGTAGTRQTVALTTTFQRHTLRFVSTATNNLTQSLRMYIPGTTWPAGSWFEWHSLFVGEGSSVASWSPAPEDADGFSGNLIRNAAFINPWTNIDDGDRVAPITDPLRARHWIRTGGGNRSIFRHLRRHERGHPTRSWNGMPTMELEASIRMSGTTADEILRSEHFDDPGNVLFSQINEVVANNYLHTPADEMIPPWNFTRATENNTNRNFTLSTSAGNEMANPIFAFLPGASSPGNVTGYANVIHIRSARTGSDWGLRMSFPAVTIEQGKQYMLDFELWVVSATQMSYTINTGGASYATNPDDPRRWFWGGSSGVVQGTAIQEQVGRWERHQIIIDSTFTRDDRAPQSQLEAFQIRLWGAAGTDARSFEGFIRRAAITEYTPNAPHTISPGQAITASFMLYVPRASPTANISLQLTSRSHGIPINRMLMSLNAMTIGESGFTAATFPREQWVRMTRTIIVNDEDQFRNSYISSARFFINSGSAINAFVAGVQIHHGRTVPEIWEPSRMDIDERIDDNERDLYDLGNDLFDFGNTLRDVETRVSSAEIELEPDRIVNTVRDSTVWGDLDAAIRDVAGDIPDMGVFNNYLRQKFGISEEEWARMEGEGILPRFRHELSSQVVQTARSWALNFVNAQGANFLRNTGASRPFDMGSNGSMFNIDVFANWSHTGSANQTRGWSITPVSTTPIAGIISGFRASTGTMSAFNTQMSLSQHVNLLPNTNYTLSAWFSTTHIPGTGGNSTLHPPGESSVTLPMSGLSIQGSDGGPFQTSAVSLEAMRMQHRTLTFEQYMMIREGADDDIPWQTQTANHHPRFPAQVHRLSLMQIRFRTVHALHRVQLRAGRTEAQFTAGTDNVITFSGIKLNIGHEILDWSPHFSEVYNSSTTIDEGGITVGRTQQGANVNYETRMSPNQFNISRITDNVGQEIFKADGNSVDMSNAVIANSLHLGRVAVNNIQGRWHFTNAGSDTSALMETFTI
jgi:hypothetical protein